MYASSQSVSWGTCHSGLGPSLYVLLIQPFSGCGAIWGQPLYPLDVTLSPQTGVRCQVQEYGLTLAVHLSYLTVQRVIQSL